MDNISKILSYGIDLDTAKKLDLLKLSISCKFRSKRPLFPFEKDHVFQS